MRSAPCPLAGGLLDDLLRPLWTVLRLDVRLQRRYGLYHAAVFSILVWEVLVHLVPASARPAVMPYVVFGDSVLIGFFFVAGAVFLERGERTLFALLVTPVRFGHYLAGKLMTLASLSLFMAMLLILTAHGTDFAPIALIAGILLCTVLFLLVGLATAAPFPSMTDWVLPSTAAIAVLNVPLLTHSGLFDHPAFYALPTTGSLLLLGSAFGQVDLSGWEPAYALGYQALWIAVLAAVIRRVFDRFIVAKEGAE